jgi:autotransporter-associated beta strand protein
MKGEGTMNSPAPADSVDQGITTTWKVIGINNYTTAHNWTAGVPGEADTALFPDVLVGQEQIVTGIGTSGAKSVGTWRLASNLYTLQIVEDFTFLGDGVVTRDEPLIDLGESVTLTFRNSSLFRGRMTVRPGARVRFMDASYPHFGIIWIERNATVSFSSSRPDRSIGAAFNINAGGTLDVSGFRAPDNKVVCQIQGAGTVQIGNNKFFPLVFKDDGKFPGVIAGTGSVELGISSPAAFSFLGVNTYAGGTTLSGNSVLSVAADSGLGAATGGIDFVGGALRLLNGFNLAASRPITAAYGMSATFDTNGFDTTVAQPIAGWGGLTKAGKGTMTLTGHCTYKGPTIVTGGVLRISNGTLPKSCEVVVIDGALDLGDDPGTVTEVGLLSGTGGTISIAGTLIVDVSRDVTLATSIGGGGKLVKKGNGTLTLAGANTYTGVTTVEAGGLVVSGGIAGDVALHAEARLEGGGRIGGKVIKS